MSLHQFQGTTQKSLLAVLTLLSCLLSVEGELVWPAGQYGVTKSMYGCPSANFAWSAGTVTQALQSSNTKSKSFHIDANVTSDGVSRSFCLKMSTGDDSGRPQWPDGNYCIYKKGDACPIGLQSGYILWDNRFVFDYSKATGEVPQGFYTDSSTIIYFCCSTRGDVANPVSLPIGSPFYLLAGYGSKACQTVKGAISRIEYIFYNTDGTNKLFPVYPYTASVNHVTIHYCYYQACWSNFTSLNGTIMSPFYPTDYPQNIDCRWTIQVPKNYHITIQIDDIDLESSSSSCNKDWILIKGLSGIRLCKKPVIPIIDTKSNVVEVVFHSDQSATVNKGFKLTYFAVQNTDVVSTTTFPRTTASIMSNFTTISPNESLPTTTAATTTKITTKEVILTTELHTKVFTEVPATTQSNSSAVARESSRPQSYKAWTIIVAVCLVTLVLAIIMVLVYFKYFRKRSNDYEYKRRSVVTYSKKQEGDYVDMDFQSNSVFGAKTNPGIPVYDNYPSDDEGGNINNKNVKQEAVNPIYETMTDETEQRVVEKCQDNVLYGESTSNDANVYEELPSPRKKQNNVYESASLPAGNHDDLKAG